MTLAKAFDPMSESYVYGNNTTSGETKPILHPDLKTIPRQLQVQLTGYGTAHDHEELAMVKLSVPHLLILDIANA